MGTAPTLDCITGLRLNNAACILRSCSCAASSHCARRTGYGASTPRRTRIRTGQTGSSQVVTPGTSNPPLASIKSGETLWSGKCSNGSSTITTSSRPTVLAEFFQSFNLDTKPGPPRRSGRECNRLELNSCHGLGLGASRRPSSSEEAIQCGSSSAISSAVREPPFALTTPGVAATISATHAFSPIPVASCHCGHHSLSRQAQRKSTRPARTNCSKPRYMRRSHIKSGARAARCCSVAAGDAPSRNATRAKKDTACSGVNTPTGMGSSTMRPRGVCRVA